MSNLKELIDPKDIDLVIAQHAEPDHSGALPHLLAYKPDMPVYCTKMGVRSLKGHYHTDWNFIPVKTGDKLSTGSRELTFIEAPMLHWPDTMMSYLDGANILFSNDVFGQHFSSEFLFDDQVPAGQLDYEAMKYYVNIIAPFAKKVSAKLTELKEMKLGCDIICPAHGMIWRDNTEKIIGQYEKFANGYEEDRITIIYDTMYGSTRKMAEAMAAGIRSAAPSTIVKILNGSKYDGSDILTEVFRSKGIMVGSPAVNNGILKSIMALLDEMKNLGLGGRKAAAFGSYGWSPASIKIINTMLEEAGFEITGKGTKVNWVPDEKAKEQCRDFGKEFAESFK
jgi:flavorubredoxin